MADIVYVYSAHSAFAYLGSAKLAQVSAAQGARLIHKPILLSPVVENQKSAPFHDRTQAHVDYFFGREIERWAEHRSVPIINFRPTYHDASYAVASGMIIALGETGAQTDKMAHAILGAHWRDDADLSDLETLHNLASDLGHDADALLEQAASPAIQAKLHANSDWAKTQSVFGSPTYIVNGDPFYGQDRLELVERALNKAFSAPGFTNPNVTP